MVWNFQYLLNAYGQFVETVLFDIGGWYEIKAVFTFNLFDLDLWKQEVLFVHPWMILDQKMTNNVEMPFDIKLRTSFTINDVLSTKLKVTDRLRANFNKQLDGLAAEALKFIGTAFSGQTYEAPAEDTLNIANGMNFLPNATDFKYGGQFLTNNYNGVSAKTALQHQNSYEFSFPLWLLRLIYNDAVWSYSTLSYIDWWIFNTGMYTN